MKIIGITGGTGAGKSSICACLERSGAEIVDADAISRTVTKKGGSAFDEIVSFFGKEILKEDGEIDRKYLGNIVFSEKEKLNKLNEITHKHIFAVMKKRIEECEKEFVVLDVPLLFQEDFPIECDLKVAVIAEPNIRLERIMRRDGIDRQQATARMKNQMSNEEYRRLADFCVENNGREDEVLGLAEEIIKKSGLR